MKRRYILFALLLFLFMGKVMADDYITTFEITNEQLDIEPNPSLENHYKLKINNLPTSGGSDDRYYAYFVNNATDPFDSTLLTANEEGCVYPSMDTLKMSGLMAIDSEKKEVEIPQSWYIYSKYEYAYIGYTYMDSTTSKRMCKISTTPIHVDKATKAPLPSASSMYSTSFALINNELHVYPEYPYSSTNGEFDIKVLTKVGQIKDVELLNKLAADYNANINALIEYAKNDTENVIFNDSQPISSLTDKNVAEDAKKLVLGSYYYIYNTATSTDVDLRNTEGILVAVAETNTDGGNYLAAFTDWSKFNEGGQHNSVDPQSQPQEANPKTGMFISVLSLAILTGGIILISLKNKQHIFKI